MNVYPVWRLLYFRNMQIKTVNRRDMKSLVMSPIPVTLGMRISAVVYIDLFESQWAARLFWAPILWWPLLKPLLPPVERSGPRRTHQQTCLHDCYPRRKEHGSHLTEHSCPPHVYSLFLEVAITCSVQFSWLRLEPFLLRVSIVYSVNYPFFLSIASYIVYRSCSHSL